jgi:hypothetical protein
MRLSPVNSSAPPITTRISPSANTVPPSKRVTPKGRASPLPVVIVTVIKIAPKAMKAPARTASAKSVMVSRPAFCTPTLSANTAMSCGIKGSI